MNEQEFDSFECDETKILFFDLETALFDIYTNEILQIEVKAGHLQFHSYITPTRFIHPKASELNGLTRINKNLYKNGIQVSILPKNIVLQKLLEFLKQFDKKCILVDHKCEFDSQRLIYALQDYTLLFEFS